MRWQADDALRHGSLHWDRWAESWEGIRSATAKLVNATPGEIAIVKNTSEGIATVALGFPWQPGDRVVAFHEEFPANYYIWKKLEEWKGVRVTWLSCESSLEEIEREAEGARFLAISFVQYLTGFRADLSAIGAICNGVLFVAAEWQDRIEPMEFGWTTVAGFADYASRDMTLRKDAGRYECGTLNTITCFGLRASLELILEVGVGAVAAEVTRLTNKIAAEASRRGWEVMGGLERSSGIICIRKPGEDARLTYARLKREAILTSPRQGWVRCSPHFYVGDAGIERLVEVFGQAS
jgi:selenocysteine lyase/cysteine desulfurase